ncbi:MAG: hypothetical protein DWH80_15610 [Planctomycetota bacterium]|nr:MAG: hypothetical protein DWH72_01580 [Planctomycetota bacterium]RLS28990.1 MAG: hypothetical protein DWH80_15610 [Planctomycetota bacterium]
MLFCAASHDDHGRENIFRLSAEGVCQMSLRKLRVYNGPEVTKSSVSTLHDFNRDKVRVTLGEVLPILADAVASDRTWLSDFADDEISISSDLYDVLQAYRHFRRPGA